jgi:hypothetical protein
VGAYLARWTIWRSGHILSTTMWGTGELNCPFRS